jgi:glucose/arabinose dehydrogenase
MKTFFFPLLFGIFLSVIAMTSVFHHFTFFLMSSAQEEEQERIPGISNLDTSSNEPIIKDPSLKAEIVVEGLKFPTTMAFLGPNDILVLEKQKGTVQRIVDGKMLSEPLIDVNVDGVDERGMLGIAIAKNVSDEIVYDNDGNRGVTNTTDRTYVFLYYTETQIEDGGDPAGNRLYRYEFISTNNKLVNPKLLLDLPANPGPEHNGGAITVGPDNNLYIPIGNLIPNSYTKGDFDSKAQNYENGSEPDGRGGILRVTQDGKVVNGKGILGEENPLNKYFAYGIRNSFGLDFDPVSKNVWDTENGPTYGDEINLVEPGFNSGWSEVQGMSSKKNDFDPANLVDFEGKGIYSDPEFEFRVARGLTALKFYNSDKLGEEYENDLFVGDISTGTIYHFDVNENRTNVVLEGVLADKVANGKDEDKLDKQIVFATNGGGVSDLEVGPYDGYLYFVSLGQGKIFRIVPS